MYNCERLGISKAMKIQVMLFWIVMLCSEMVGYQCFRRPCCLCLHLQDWGQHCLPKCWYPTILHGII